MKKDTKHLFNEANERAKYKYRIHKKRVGRKDMKTVVAELKHIREYEQFTGFKDFNTFNDMVAEKYINHLFDKGCSLSFITDNLRALRDFLNWLERQRGYRSKLDYNHIEYLQVSNNQRRMAKATEYKKSYTYEQIIQTIRLMSKHTTIDQRNIAIVSLQAACGLRIAELRTVRIKNLICEDGVWFIDVNPKHMQVKFAKHRHATFMPLPGDIIQNIIAWRDYLISQGFSANDPLFPAIPSQFTQHNLLQSNLGKTPIKSDTTIRNIFKRAFEAAGHEYLRPHSFRHTIARFAEKQSPAFYNAVSKSLGHSDIDTTRVSYGDISLVEQRERIASLENKISKEENHLPVKK